MMNLILVGVLVGGVLGLRFSVFVIASATYVALAVVVVESVAHGSHVGRLVLSMITIAMALQLGYLGGTAVRLVKGTARETHHGGVSLPT